MQHKKRKAASIVPKHTLDLIASLALLGLGNAPEKGVEKRPRKKQ
jgi:hypothetical protein